LREQLGESVKVMEVYPPSVDTEMNAYNRTRKVSVEEYNEQLMASLAKGGDEHWIGEAKYVPLMNRIAPKKTFRFINDAVQLVEIGLSSSVLGMSENAEFAQVARQAPFGRPSDIAAA
jgi:hypothetical protein